MSSEMTMDEWFAQPALKELLELIGSTRSDSETFPAKLELLVASGNSWAKKMQEELKACALENAS